MTRLQFPSEHIRQLVPLRGVGDVGGGKKIPHFALLIPLDGRLDLGEFHPCLAHGAVTEQASGGCWTRCNTLAQEERFTVASLICRGWSRQILSSS
jgi:hypothetical protein